MEKVIFFSIHVSSVIIVFVITVGIIIALNKVFAGEQDWDKLWGDVPLFVLVYYMSRQED